MGQQDEQQRIEEITRIVLRPLASPLPLAFFAFGAGSVLQSAWQLGLIPQEENPSRAIDFPLQFLGSMLAFYTRETLGATVLGLIGFSWLSTSFVTYTTAPDTARACLMKQLARYSRSQRCPFFDSSRVRTALF